MRLSSQFIFALLLAISSAAVTNVTAQDLYVGSNTPNNATNFTSGTNSYSNTYVGFTTNSSNNLLTVGNTGTLLSNSQFLYVGVQGSSNSLEITNGGTVANSFGYIGQQANSSNNSVLVTGSNSLWTNSDNLFVGDSGSSNSLVISNGGTVANRDGRIGDQPTSSNNSVLVTGSNSVWTNSSVLYVGNNGSGNSLLISNGGDVASGIGYIGNAATSSNNSVLVTGEGSLWTNSNILYVGLRGSSNSLVITNGGRVANSFGSIGNAATSSNNSVLVTGSNSLWTNSLDLYVGSRGSSNRLVVSDGGAVSAFFIAAGFRPGANHNQVIVGSNSTITVTDKFDVGFDGSSNSLVITNGGQVFLGAGGSSIGSFLANGNSVLVTGAGSTLSNSGIYFVGFQGAGNQLTLTDEGSLVSDELSVGGSVGGGLFGSNNAILVTSNASMTVNGVLSVGGEGAFNSMTVSGGGTVTAVNGYIGNQATSSNNSVLVTGAGSLWTNSYELYVGNAGSGNSLVISDGGTVANSYGNIGFATTSSNNSVLVTGTGSTWSNTNALYVGANGSSNSLIISNGGMVVNEGGFIGANPTSSNNSVLVTGTGSTWSNTSGFGLYVGSAGSSNSLVINDGGSVVNTGVGYIGNQATSSNNSVLVTGAGSTWTNNGGLFVGFDGSSNHLEISDGGSVVNTLVYIGFTTNSSNNSVLVTGTNSNGDRSTWTNSGNLVVGERGSGNSLVISNGGKVANAEGNIGFFVIASNNSVTVTGTGSDWINSADLIVGTVGSGNSLLISNGGEVASAAGYIGFNPGSSNSVTVTDADSIWTNSQQLFVGLSGSSNSLVISNGGKVANAAGYIGLNPGSSNNSVLVTGTNSNGDHSTWTNSGSLEVGAWGSGNTLTISDGGTVFAANLGVGVDSNSANNSVMVTGSNSLLSFWEGRIGQGGRSNSLIVSNGAKVTNGWTYIGTDTNSDRNSIVVTGAGTRWDGEVDFNVGYNGSSNTLVVSDGAAVAHGGHFRGAALGVDAGSSNNSALVSGSNSSWTSTAGFFVGYGGSGNSLVISNGGAVSNAFGDAGGAMIGRHSNASNNSVLVTGSNSSWTSSADFYVGNAGSDNSLVITNGGRVSVASASFVGFEQGSVGNRVLVTGTNSLWTNSGFLYVGEAGSSNSLVISNGGSVANNYGYIGLNTTSSNNMVMVTGSNSLWTNSDIVVVGQNGSGNSLVISNGGRVVSLFGYLSYSNPSSNNSVTVTDVGSIWTNSGDLFVGFGFSSNSLVISNGGKVANASGYIGASSASSNSTAVVTGAGSTWTNSDALVVGVEGSGNILEISNGGEVVSTFGVIGEGTNSSNNFAVVTGADSTWANSEDFSVGYRGSGNSLVISNGGKVASAEGYIGLSDTAWSNSVVVTDGGAWTNSVDLYVGKEGSGNSLVISNGGKVANVFGYIGHDLAASNNSVLVTGAGSIWTNSGNLTIGAGGAVGNMITITNGGQVQAGRVIVNAGTLRTAVTNALGSSAVTLGGGPGAMAAMALSTNLSISSLIWSNNSVMSLTPGAQQLSIDGAFTSGGGGVFDFGGFTNNLTNTLITFGTNSGFNVSNFSARDNANWNFILNGNSLQAWYGVNALIARPNNTIVSNSATYPSVIFQTNGILTVTTGATLTITSSVTASNNGTVDVNGVLSTPAMIIPTGGTLMGTGTLSLTGGNLTINGAFAPGNSPGTFFVSGGNLVMGSSSVWDQQIYSASVYDRVVVTGSAILNGTMNITTDGVTQLQFGQKYNFLTASGGISGAFSSIVAPEGFRGRLLLSGNNTQANILIAPASYAQLAANRNQTNVATALNSFIPYTSGDQLVVSTSLDSLTASQYNQAFNAIMPNFYQQIATIAFNNASAQNMQLVQRLWGLRVAEGGGFSMSGLADNMPLLEGQGDGKGVLDSKKDILRPGLDNHWGIFVDGNGIFAQANSGNMLPGYNSQSGGVTTGLTYKWNENVGTGIYCGYQGTYTKSGADGSGLGTGSRLIDNAVRFGVFGTYGQKDGKGLFVNALAGGGYHNFQATRVIQYTGMNRTANSAPGAGELDTMLAAGYDIKKGKFTFGPTASLQYTYLGVNSLNETGAQSLSFNSGGWNSSSMLSSVGAHAAYSWVASKNILVVPQVNLSWQHEFMQNPYAISGNLGGTSPTFSNWSATPIRDFLYTGVGFTVEFAKRWNTSFFYNAAAGNSDLVSQNIFWSAGVKF